MRSLIPFGPYFMPGHDLIDQNSKNDLSLSQLVSFRDTRA